MGNKLVDLGNLGLVVEAIDKTGYTDNNLFVFKDHAGFKLGVDAKAGKVYRVAEDGSTKVFATEDTSNKADGRLVAVFNYLSDEGIIKPYRITQHQLVALIAHRTEFDNFVKIGIKPYACHINSTPWDCRADNIEWGLPRWNAWQGKLGASLEHYYPDKYTKVYLRRFNRGSSKGKLRAVITLRKGITNKQILEFATLGYDLVIHRGMEDKYYSKRLVKDFISFMISKNYW